MDQEGGGGGGGSNRASATAEATIGGVWMPSPTLVTWLPDSLHFVVGNGLGGVLATYFVEPAVASSSVALSSGVVASSARPVRLVSVLAHQCRLAGLVTTPAGVFVWTANGNFHVFPPRSLRPHAPFMMLPIPSAAAAVAAAAPAGVRRRRSVVTQCGASHVVELVDDDVHSYDDTELERQHRRSSYVVVLCRIGMHDR